MPRKQEDEREARQLARRIGSRAGALRRRRGWTQSLLAEHLEMSSEAYGRIERGASLPSFPTFVRLYRVLETSPDVLLVDRPMQTAAPRGAIVEVEDAHLLGVDLAALWTEIQGLDQEALRALEGVVHVMWKAGRARS